MTKKYYLDDKEHNLNMNCRLEGSQTRMLAAPLFQPLKSKIHTLTYAATKAPISNASFYKTPYIVHPSYIFFFFFFFLNSFLFFLMHLSSPLFFFFLRSSYTSFIIIPLLQPKYWISEIQRYSNSHRHK